MATMSEIETSALDRARTTLGTAAGQLAGLLGSLPAADILTPIPGSKWTVRDAAAHLISYAPLYGEIANGVASPVDAPAGDGAIRTGWRGWCWRRPSS